MKKHWSIGILAAWTCWAQAPPLTPQQMEAAIEADLRGRIDREAGPPDGVRGNFGTAPPAFPQPEERPTGQSISVARLRHKVPKAASALFERARKDANAGHHPRAASELEEALARDPEFAAAYAQLGVEYTRLGRDRDAETALRRSLDLDPNSATANYYLGVVQFRSGDAPGAELSARRAVQQAAENAWAHFFLGYVLWGRVDAQAEALQHLQYAARTLPDAKRYLADLRELQTR